MSQPFPEQVAPGGILVYPQIQSPDYVAGSSGWAVFRDGSVEFNNGTFRGYIVDGGMFVYSGTPGPGNPPVVAITPPGTTEDPYGNAISSDVIVGQPGSPQVWIIPNGTYGGEIRFPLPGTWPNSPNIYGKTQLSGGVLSLDGPTDTTVSDQAYIALESAGASGIGVSNGQLNYTDANGAAHEWAFWDCGGLSVIAAQPIPAVTPGTGTSPTNPATPESWHAITLDSGWTAASGFDAPRYRLLPDGNLQLSGAASRAAFTANTNLNNSNPLPSAYRPVNTHHYRGVDNLSVGTVRAGVQISSGGVIEALTAGTSCTFIEIDAVIPLN